MRGEKPAAPNFFFVYARPVLDICKAGFPWQGEQMPSLTVSMQPPKQALPQIPSSLPFKTTSSRPIISPWEYQCSSSDLRDLVLPRVACHASWGRLDHLNRATTCLAWGRSPGTIEYFRASRNDIPGIAATDIGLLKHQGTKRRDMWDALL